MNEDFAYARNTESGCETYFENLDLYIKKVHPSIAYSLPNSKNLTRTSAKHFTLTVPLSTQVYTLVMINLMLGVTLQWNGIPSRGEKKCS